MSDQLSWFLSDEVAPYFNNEFISSLCNLIDEKAVKGLKYQDLKQMLLDRLVPYLEADNTIYNRAYEFARYY
jgi:hypothetical protein